jgi:Ca-activated chloride channel family protein
VGIEYDNLANLHLLWIVAGVALVAVYGLWQRRQALIRFADIPLLGRLAPRGGILRRAVRLGLVGLTLLALVAALLGPRWGEREQKVIRRGVDVFVVLDVSRSMLARDLTPNRLERAKLWIQDDLVPALGGDRIGLICFAGVARLKCPLTNDYGYFRLALNEVSPDSVPVGGTLVGDALRLAAESFRGPLDTHKLVILITDAEEHEGQESYPVEAAAALWQKHEIPVVAVGIGDEREGARIPAPTGADGAYVQYEGRTVWSRANFDTLRRIAAASPMNAFLPVGARNADLGEIYRNTILPAVRYREREETERVQRPAQFQWFALAALVLLFADSLLRDGPRPSTAQVAARRRAA